jgi:hypothetical protein
MNTRHPEVNVGLISSTGDTINRTFFSAGMNDCAVLDESLTGLALLAYAADPDNMMTIETFETGLLNFRQTVQDGSMDFATYYIDSTEHIWFMDDVFYTEDIGGVTPAGWLQDLLDGTVSHVGP